MSQRLLTATAAPTAFQMYVNRGRKVAGPGVHSVSPGLLQLTVLRHRRRSHEPAAVCPECGCTSGDGRSTVRPYHASATGFQFDVGVGWISRWPPWSTCHCPAWLQPILPPTASWFPTKLVVSCVLPHRGRVLSNEHTATMETGVLQLQVRSCGTAFELNCDKLTLAFNDLSGY